MNYRDFINGNYSGAYILIGVEKLLMDSTITTLENRLNPVFLDFNYLNYEGSQVDLDKLQLSWETLPVMDSRKLIVVKDVSGFERVNKPSGDFIEKLKNLPENVLLIFVETDPLSKTTSFYKQMKKNGGVVEYNKLNQQEVRSFIRGYLKNHGKTMKPMVEAKFIDYVGYFSRNIERNLFDVVNELQKLLNLSTGDEIDLKNLEESQEKSIDTNIFNFIGELNRRNVEGSLREFENLYTLNEPPYRIFTMVVRQIRLLLSYMSLAGSGYDGTEYKNIMNIKDYEYRKLQGAAKNFTREGLLELYNYAMDLDLQFKTTSPDEKVEIEKLIVKLCSD